MRIFLWVAATVVGCATAGAMGHFPGSFPVGNGTLGIAFAAGAYGLFIGTVLALPLGVLQWLVVRRMGIARRWIAATAVGVGLMHAAGDGAPAPYNWGGSLSAGDGWLAIGALGGLIIGALQVLAAPGRLVPWTWVAGSVIAWPLGIVAGLAIAHGTGLMTQSGPAAWAQQHALVGVVTGLVVGILTGVLIPRSRPLTPVGATAY